MVHQRHMISLFSFQLKGCLHDISFRAKRNIFNSVSGQYCEMKLTALVLFHFDRNETSFRVINVMQILLLNEIIQKEISAHANIL